MYVAVILERLTNIQLTVMETLIRKLFLNKLKRQCYCQNM